MRISYTLSRYIFWDLLRIFLMASGALAGIMSFGGLLRPLTQQGLDAGQVGQLLSYFTPAMTAYSFPIAALFATTMVYGRLSADNELTACRAAGISLLSVAVPAFLLGSLVVLTSFLFLSFVVPAFTLKAEKVIYSNIAKLIASRIDRAHQIPFGMYTIFAQDAYLPPPETLKPGEQQVVLVGATIVKFKRPFGKDDWHYKVPEEFWTAGNATAYINDTGENTNPEMTVALRDGMTFPRSFKGGMTTAIGALQFGPVPMQSPIKENTKFMDLRQLKRLYLDQQQSHRIQDNINEFLKHDQEFQYLRQVRDALNATRRHAFHTVRGEDYVLSFGEDVVAVEKGEEVVVAPPDPSRDPGGVRRIRVQRVVGGKVETVMQAREARLRVWPRRGTGQIDVSLKLMEEVTQGALPPDATQAQTPPAGPADAPAGPAPMPGGAKTTPTPTGVKPTAPPGAGGGVGEGGARAMLPLAFKVAMPKEVQALEQRKLDYYESPAAAGSGNQNKLKRELIVLRNDLVSEMHARMAFALSCLILVLVGCALGMMFRSGNFLTAFAVSFVPALMTITLIIAGQQTCGNIPWNRGPNWVNPLNMGVALIWSGNVVNLAIASTLLWRLWRT
jgi:lipopolysaccharide export LptBFGC system permease protein LptF